MDDVRQARVDERRRISRELHDTIGHGVGVAQRDLELFEIYRLTDPERALARVQSARHRLTETLEAIRLAIDNLRRAERTESLENGIRLYLESSADPELARRVEVTGDETCVPEQTIEEAFLILRESLRNTIAHAQAHQVTVCVDISPTELRASVVDDGRGFDLAARNGGGTGLLSMSERAALLGGSLVLTTVPGGGTHVELRLPLVGATTR